MNAQLTKDESILDLIGRLKCRLGDDAFDVVDHWESDLFSIGIARPDNHGVLVYICTFERPPENYFVSIELPPKLGTGLPYTPCGDFQVEGSNELVHIIRKHFGVV
jgi:hypothetical protein